MTPRKNVAPDPTPEGVFSLEALQRAWRMVRRNGNSPGFDGVTLTAFERDLAQNLEHLRHEVLKGSYRPQPVKRFYMPKASGGNRPLSLWSVRDRVLQRVVHDYLTPTLEALFLPCSYGFRPERSTEDAIQAVVRAYDAKRRWVLDADITRCFDSIPIGLLVGQVRRVVSFEPVVQLIKLWLNTPVWGQLGEKAGVSQGSVIAPQLANLYLHRFDQMILAALPGAYLVRFADDFVILCRQRVQAEWALEVAHQSLASLKLELNPAKTRVVHFQEGFTFLGVTFKGKRQIKEGG